MGSILHVAGIGTNIMPAVPSSLGMRIQSNVLDSPVHSLPLPQSFNVSPWAAIDGFVLGSWVSYEYAIEVYA